MALPANCIDRLHRHIRVISEYPAASGGRKPRAGRGVLQREAIACFQPGCAELGLSPFKCCAREKLLQRSKESHPNYNCPHSQPCRRSKHDPLWLLSKNRPRGSRFHSAHISGKLRLLCVQQITHPAVHGPERLALSNIHFTWGCFRLSRYLPIFVHL